MKRKTQDRGKDLFLNYKIFIFRLGKGEEKKKKEKKYLWEKRMTYDKLLR